MTATCESWLNEKVSIITGGAAGIGKETAFRFGAEGAKVVIADVDRQDGEGTAREIRAKGGSAIFVQADISVESDARRITEEAIKRFGSIDILVNNAAIFVLKGFDATVEDWQRSLSVNVIGTALVTKYAAETMKRNGGGAIVIVSSVSSWIAQPNFFAYSATKAALLQMTRNMAMDLAPCKIRVNCVCPGAILTSASYRYMKEARLTPEQFDAEQGAQTLLKRVGRPKEVARAILFLASEEASYITGTHLMVDGGYTTM
jgi:NAD(P)-dependent dehydrogenase (short-subunit alcohol dehydrogenase family)